MLTLQHLSNGIFVALSVFCLTWLLSFGANLLALLMLLKSRQNRNQRIILLNLSITELVFSVTIPIRLVPYFHACSVCWYLSRLETWIGFWYYLSLYLISADRLVCLLTGVKYRTLVRPTTLKYVSFGISATCFVSSLPFYFISSKQTQFVVNSVIYPVLEFFFVVFTIFVYSLILYRLQRRGKHLGKTKLSIYQHFRKHYFTPLLIILSFVVFVQIPAFYIIFTVYMSNTPSNEDNEREKYLRSVITYSCWFTAFFLDSFIYIYANKTMKNFVLDQLCVLKNRRRRRINSSDE